MLSRGATSARKVDWLPLHRESLGVPAGLAAGVLLVLNTGRMVGAGRHRHMAPLVTVVTMLVRDGSAHGPRCGD